MHKHLEQPVFKLIGQVADELQRPCFVIGGYVRDIVLCRQSKDIDVVTLGSGIELAEALCKKLGRRAHLSVFRNFGTAQVKYRNGTESWEVEFVVLVVSHTHTTLASQLWKTVPYKTIKTVVTSQSTPWHYASTATATANW